MTLLRDRSGFTLIEVLVSVTLITLFFSVFLVTVTMGLAKVREVDRETGAIAWVQSAMDTAMALGVDGLPAGGRYEVGSVLPEMPPPPVGFQRAELTIRVLSMRPLLKEFTVAVYREVLDARPAFSLTSVVGPRP